MTDATTNEPTQEVAPKVTRPRLDKFPDEHVITILKENAKSRTANARFKVYFTGMTVKQYVEALTGEPFNRTEAQTQADMRWDSNADHMFIHIGPHIVDVPPPPPPKEAAEPKPRKPRKPKLKAVENPDQPAA